MASDQQPATPPQDSPHGSLLHVLHLVRPLFDARYYADQYPDVTGDAEALLLHFCERGWKEGRNPHDGFDSVAYLHTHPDVVQVGWNPFYHYVLAGQREGRAAARPRSPRSAAAILSRDPGDWVALVRQEMDTGFYAAQIGSEAAGVDLAAHYAFRGWLEGRDPAPGFGTAAILSDHPDWQAAGLNPLVATIAARPPPAPPALPPPPLPSALPPDQDDPGISITRFARDRLFGIADRLQALEAELAARRTDAGAAYADPVERLVAGYLDRDYYLARYADVREHQIDPVEHFCRLGWAERRNPAPWFHTGYYLDTNSDVAESQVNPFWHYLAQGRAEDRKPSRPGGFRREIIEHAVDPDTRTNSYIRPEPTGLLTRSRVARILQAAIGAANGLVVSLSHDCYVRVTGGIQLFIADEQARYARQGMVYLHLSPFAPLLRLADPAGTGCLLQVVIDGRYVGVTSYTDLASALGAIPRRAGEQRLFLVHCLLGHHLPDTVTLQRAAAATANVFWVHDYSSICLGYTLLRNDATYCHAPPPDSMACRVCVYGGRRPEHLAQIRDLFEVIPFHVVAPSEAALRVWLEHTDLPHLSANAHQHCDLVPTNEPVVLRDVTTPVRVAFIGYARAHKGWPIWMELVSRAKRLGAYQFIHLGSRETNDGTTGLEHHVVETSPGQPDAMVDAVRNLDIDLVMVLSTWPETFSYVTFESFAGGADVVCLGDSGNVADAVLQRGRGVVAANQDSLFDFFTSLRAVEYVRLCRAQGVATDQLVREGTTATLTSAEA